MIDNWSLYYYIATFIFINSLIALDLIMVKFKITFFIIFAGLYSIFIAFRDMQIGVDAATYYAFFSNEDVYIAEPVFHVLRNSLLGPNLTLALISFSSTCLMFVFFKTASKRPFICMAIYLSTFLYLNSQINIIRQGIAMPLWAIGVAIMFERKTRAGLSFLLAILTHHSTAILVVMGIPLVILLRKFNAIKLYAVCVLLLLYCIDLTDVLRYLGGLAFGEDSRLDWYLSWGIDDPWQLKHIYYVSVPAVIISLVFSYVNKKKDLGGGLEVVLVVGLCAMVFRSSEMFADRILYYAIPFFIAYYFSMDSIKNRLHLISFLISNVWLMKTSFIQLRPWFIDYAM